MPRLLLASYALLMLALVLYVFWRQRQMKRRQDEIAKGLKGHRFWRVNLARPAFFARWRRLMPFEAKGVMIDEGDQLRVRGFWRANGRAFESVLRKADCQPIWLGNRSLKAGNMYWGQLRTPRGDLLFSADTGLYALPSRENLMDIFHTVFPEFDLPEEAEQEFALEKNVRSISAMVVFFGLMAFALIDTFFITRYELTDAQLFRMLSQPVALLGALIVLSLAGAGFYRWLSSGRVPARESIALSILTTGVLALATLPIAKRVDQVLASEPSRNYAYHVVQPARLLPADTSQGLPALRFPRARDYWAQFKDGQEYQIPFLRGPLGLWQLDHEKFDPPLRAFYEKQSAGK